MIVVFLVYIDTKTFSPTEIPYVRNYQGGIGGKLWQGCSARSGRDMKNFGTSAIPSITITLKADLLFRNFLFLPYKFSGGKSELEWYTFSRFWKTRLVLGWAPGRVDARLSNMKYSKGGGGHRDTHKGAMVERYKPWALLVILLSVKLRWLVFQIIVFKQIKLMPCPH